MTSDLHAVRDEARREASKSGGEVTMELWSKGIGFGRITARPDGTIGMDELEGVDTDLIVRPFMQKGTIVSLREFAVKAMNQHFGMQASERFGDAGGPRRGRKGRRAIQGGHDGAGDVPGHAAGAGEGRVRESRGPGRVRTG